MSIVIDLNKEFINIVIYYIEEKKRQEISVFNFIRNEDEFKAWKERGYKPETELAKEMMATQPTVQTGQSRPIVVPPDANEGKIIKEIHTSWRRMTWKEQNSVWSSCLQQITGPDGNPKMDFDGLKYRELKLKACLKGWNITDDRGEPIELSDTAIDNLVPEAARELLDNFEKVTEFAEERN